MVPRRDFGPQGACIPDFDTDISNLFYNAPGNGWMVVSHDCSTTPGCNDYFYVTCSPNDLVQATFCSHGGGAAWDTSLSVWTGGNLEMCDDDTCGQLSDLVYMANGAVQRYRVGGGNGASGPYSLAVNIPASCFIGPPIGVGLQAFDVE